MSFGFSVGDFIAAIELTNKIRKEFADAPSQFEAVSDEIRSLSIVLQDADVTFPKQELNKDQKRDLEDIDKGCRNVLDELQRIIDKNSELSSKNGSVGKRIKRVWKRLNWKPEEIHELRSRISTNISFLNAFNGRLTRDNVVKLVQHQEDQGRQTVLDWITPIDYAPQQSDFINRRQEGTGQWLLDSAEFHTWVEIEKQTLFCPGIPGAGKTILTSIVVDDLVSRFHKDSTTGIAYIYCNFNRQEKQKVGDLLASVLKQLAESQPSLPGSVKDLYNHHKAKRTRPSLDEISKALESVVAIYSRVFLIVDALDECQASDGCRARFLSELFNLQTRHGANIFATSRFIPEIIDQFKGSVSLEIRASTGDVDRYLEGHIGRLPFFVQRNRPLQEEIKMGISEAVDGMFLLAQIYLGLLDDKLTPNDIRNTLEVFRKQSRASGQDQKAQVLAHAYEQAVERINAQKPGLKNLAMKVLLWITCAKRQLTALELQHALATKVGKSNLDQGDLPYIGDMVSVCSGLVTIDEKSKIIRLVHYTTQEYFQRTREHWFPNAELEITKICVTYLSFTVFESGYCETDEAFEKRLWSNPLYNYVAHNWGYHTRKTPTLCQEVIDFLESDVKVEASGQAMMAVTWHSSYWSYSQEVPRHMRALHLAAYFGLKEVMSALLSRWHRPELIDSFGRTPLSYAAENGHRTIVQLLLDKRADIDSKDTEWGRTPLSYAAENGHKAIVQLLLDQRADIESKDSKYNSTPILWAAWRGHEDVVKLLLEKSAEPEPRNFFNSTPLSLAVYGGHIAVVKLLLDTGKVDADSKDVDYRTPLSYAAEDGYEAIVQLLLDTSKVDADSKDKDYRTPLSYAAKGGYEAIVQLLLDTGKVDADLKDDYCRTPLLWAVGSGHKGVVKLLKDDYCRTPLLWAVGSGHKGVVKLLLDVSKVDADAEDEYNLVQLS